MSSILILCKKQARKTLSGILWLLLIILITRYFFFDIYRVPSDSMKNALRGGNYIITSKTLYGGIFSNLNIKSHPKLNDILVFKIAGSDTAFYVKRCVGLPNQVIEIKDGKALIGGRYIEEPYTVRHLYKLWYNNFSLIQENLLKSNKIDLFDNMLRRFPRYIVMYLDNSQKEALLDKRYGFDSITLFNISGNKKTEFLSDTMLYGNEIQNLRPILIPFAGMKIKLDSNIFQTYENLFIKYEGVKIKYNNGNRFLINGIQRNYYIFKNDYYFMMGDNRDNSIDSRYLGLIPKKCIVGKVILKF